MLASLRVQDINISRPQSAPPQTNVPPCHHPKGPPPEFVTKEHSPAWRLNLKARIEKGRILSEGSTHALSVDNVLASSDGPNANSCVRSGELSRPSAKRRPSRRRARCKSESTFMASIMPKSSKAPPLPPSPRSVLLRVDEHYKLPARGGRLVISLRKSRGTSLDSGSDLDSSSDGTISVSRRASCPAPLPEEKESNGDIDDIPLPSVPPTSPMTTSTVGGYRSPRFRSRIRTQSTNEDDSE